LFGSRRILSKLLKLKEWLTLAEAARHLSTLFEEQVTEADVLRLASDGRLQLSVFFPQPTSALSGTIITVEDVSDHLPGDGAIPFYIESMGPKEEAYWQNYFSWASNNDSVLIEKASKLVLQVRSHERISGVWDLAMYGEARSYIEKRYRKLIDLPSLSKEDPQIESIAVIRKRGEQASEVCGLLPTPLGNPVNYLPAESLLVVRTNALQELHAGISEMKPLAKRERDTLLVIIAALARIARIDVSTPSSAASAIESETVRMRARVSERTILNHLNRIPEALEDRREED
jgi:hypothetical protein